MTAPFSAPRQVPVQPQATAGSNLSTIVWVAPNDCTVSGVTYTPVSAITGANTNTRSVSLVNKGQSGAGTTAIATLQFNSGVNAAASDERVVTLSSTPADLVVAAGDVLRWESTAVGTGIADPGGLVSITTTAKYA